MTRPTCYLLGSGASLNDLTVEEREYLNCHPRTLAFNKYLLFWDVVGVAPSDYMILDRHFPSHIVFVRSLQIARQLPQKVTLYVAQLYSKYCATDPVGLLKGLKGRWTLWRKTGFWVPLDIIGTQAHYCNNILDDSLPFSWARRLDEPLYFYRGSLTSALNLATIIYPGCDIKLLGVDLYSNEYFYGDRIARFPELVDRFHQLGARADKHPTVLDIARDGKHPSILDMMPKVVDHLHSLGVSLTCCNPRSLLVTEGVCEYSPVMER